MISFTHHSFIKLLLTRHHVSGMKLKESLAMIVVGLVIGSLLTLAVLNLWQSPTNPPKNLPQNAYGGQSSHEVPASTPEKSQPSIPQVGEFKREYSRKRWMGYDVFKAHEYYVRALDAYKRGERDEAVKIFRQAVESLEKAEPLPSLPKRDWEVTDSNIMIDDVPTPHDFVPLGTIYVKSENGYIAYPSNEPRWKLSCFIYVAYGESEEGDVFVYHGRLPFTGEGPHKPRIWLNDEWIYPFPTFYSPMYYDEEKVMVYNYDASHSYIQTLTYDPEERLWIHEIKPIKGDGPRLKIIGRAMGKTFWMGRWDGPFIIHGVTFNKKDIDIWGGFWDIGEMTAELIINGRRYVFKGSFLFDRASHLTYYYDSAWEGGAGAPLEFSCFYLCQDEFCLAVAHTDNPSPFKPPTSLQHQARLNLFAENRSYPLTEFRVWDDGGIQPKIFHLVGRFDGGEIEIVGKPINYWPNRWGVSRGTWWNPEAYRTWGRATIHWTGKIVINGKVIEVDAYGIGEFTRYNEHLTG